MTLAAQVARYLVFIGVANLVWETAQLPLYTLWVTGSTLDKAYAIVHCTGGDILIAAAALAIALAALRAWHWPRLQALRVGVPAVVLGVAFTVVSEWYNVEVRETWAYSTAMPRLPPLGTGLTPVLQWLIIPVLGMWWTQSRSLRQ